MGIFNKLERISNYDEVLSISKMYFGLKEDQKPKSYKKDMKILDNYQKQILKISKREGQLKDNIVDFRWVLPPWLVFPYKKKEEVIKTEYGLVYSVFLRTLSSMERSVYEKTYPIPEEYQHL